MSKDRLNADNAKLRELLERQNEELKLRFKELTRFRRAKLTLSEFLRRQIRVKTPEAAPVRRVKCRHTGAMIFAPPSHFPILTTEAVRDMLADYP